LLALPEHRFDSIPGLVGDGASGRLLRAWDARDLQEVRRVLAGTLEERRIGLVRAHEVTPDLLHAEASALATLGDARAALEWLSPTLDSISATAPQTLANVANAGTLVRAMVLRANLAAELNDRPAARAWARAVLTLWSKPDPFLLPTATRMRELAR
jgi:hypothetical protein